MKKTCFTVLLMQIIFSVALAQTEKGRWQVGAQVGNLYYQKHKNGNSYNLSINLDPSAGYFVAKNLLVGITVPFSTNINSFSGNSGSSYSRSIGIGPFIRYYIGNTSIKPFAGVGFTYNDLSTKLVSIDKLKGRTTTLTPKAGVAFFINRNVLLSAGLGYNFYNYKNEGLQPMPNSSSLTVYTTTFESRNLSLDIGFALLFGK